MLDYDGGVLFRASNGASELFDCPLSQRSAQIVAVLLSRRWNADVEALPLRDNGSTHGEPVFTQPVSRGAARRASRFATA